MINISPTMRIVMGVLITVMGLLCLAGTAGLLAGDGSAIEAERDALTRLLATHYATALQQDARPAIEKSLRQLIAQTPDLRSITLRDNHGEPLASIGYPETAGKNRSGNPAETSEYHQARIYHDGDLWGSITARFAHLDHYGMNRFRDHPLMVALVLLALIPLGGFLLFSGIRYPHHASTACVPYQVRTTLDALAEGVLLLDAEGRIMLANTAFANSVDKVPGALLGRKASDLKWQFGRIDEDEFPWDTVQRLGEIQTGKQLCRVQASGGVRTFTVNAAPVRDGDRQRGVMVTFDDVTQLEEKNDQLEDMLSMLKKSRDEIRRQNRELQILATRDPLTNCLNRRSFFEQYETLFEEVRRGGEKMACIMVDIDLFKSINDRHGHLKGDDIIRRVAQTLQASLRTSDVICRYGGEEFCVILPGTDVDQAVATAMRARANIEAMDVATVFEHSVEQITASFGISTTDHTGTDFANFIDRADQALYTSKNSGRNRVSVWQAPSDSMASLLATRDAGTLTGDTRSTAAGETDADAEAGCMGSRAVHPGSDSPGGLHGRKLFHKRIVETIERCQKNEQQFSLLMLDLDMFRQVNTTMGVFVGDELLKEVARRLFGSLRSTDTVARLGDDDPTDPVFRLSGDEFGILLADMKYAEFTAQIANRIIDALREPIVVNGHEIGLACNIGISLYPENGGDADSLLKSAAVALYYAKCKGSNCFRFYRDDELDVSGGDIALQDELRRAFDNNELELHYQPKIDMKSGRIVCMEALLRWRHPEIGMVPPAQFLPVAESTGLSIPIGRWVLRTACTQLLAWQQRGHTDLSVAVNISLAQFARQDLLMQTSAIVEETGIAPWHLELEITESTIMEDIDHAATTLRLLHKAGMKISIDDFGTGYSSLNHLKRFPISSVKIDRSFVRHITTDADDAGIIKAIITMAHGMGLRVVAEGVESEAQLAYLGELHCNEFQGFLASPPVPKNEAGSLLGGTATPHARERLVC